VLDDFMERVSEYLSDPVVFRRALLPIEKSSDTAHRSACAESLHLLVLNIFVLE
jgi:hypothetical protein